MEIDFFFSFIFFVCFHTKREKKGGGGGGKGDFQIDPTFSFTQGW